VCVSSSQMNIQTKPIHDVMLPIFGGCIAFGTTLALSTAAQKCCGISTGNKIMPSLIGFTTVCAASLISERTAILVHDLRIDWDKKKSFNLNEKLKRQFSGISNAMNESSNDRGRYGFKLSMHEVRICIIGALAFKCLGGRFWAIAPSSYTHLGSFTRWSIPCSENYANASQRTMIEKMGRKWGCHTCGSRMFFKSSRSPITNKKFRFVGDHMPPKSVAKHMNKTWLRRIGLLPKIKFRFYPQCVSCSNMQGSILSKSSSTLNHGNGKISSKARAIILKQSGGGKSAYYHGLTPRINHLTGGVLAGSIVIGAADKEISSGNSERFKRWQAWIKNNARLLLGN